MATNIPNDSVSTLQRLQNILNTAYSKVKAGRRISAILFFFCFLIVGFLALSAIEASFYLSSSVKIYATSAIVAVALLAVYGIIKRFKVLSTFLKTVNNKHLYFMMQHLIQTFRVLTHLSLNQISHNT